MSLFVRTRPHLRHAVSVQIKGKDHLGCYYLDHDSITVHYGNKGSKPTMVGAMGPEACAQMLLLELVKQTERSPRRLTTHPTHLTPALSPLRAERESEKK
jgi:hypothetical protein